MNKNVEVVRIGAILLWLLIAVGKSQAGLYGFGVNWAGSAYTNELYAMDATSGVVTQVLGIYPDIFSHSSGSIDPASGRLYKDIITKSDGTRRLYTIDLRTGALLSSPTIDMGNTNRTLQKLYAFDGTLYGFGKYSSGSTYTNELYVIDATSGVVTQVLGVYTDIYAYAAFAGSVDPASGRLYEIITTKSDSTERLYTIDLCTGALLSSPTIDMGNTNRDLQELLGFDGALYSFGKYSLGSAYTNELYAMDATSGVVTQVLGVYTDIYSHAVGDTVDPASGRLYKNIIPKSGGANRLYTIALRTGALLSSPTIDMGNTNRILQELYAMPNIFTPTGVSASDGTYTDKVRVTWISVTGATSYLIFRSQTNTIASASQVGTSTNTTYDDAEVLNWPEVTFYYWVKATDGSNVSAFSSPDTGYLGAMGPVIKANGQLDNVILNYPAPVSITVEMNADIYTGVNVDWWVVAFAPSVGWYYLNSAAQWADFNGNLADCQPVHQGPLFNLSSTPVLNGFILPRGTYDFWFAVDYPRDGILDLNGTLLYDKVTVVVE